MISFVNHSVFLLVGAMPASDAAPEAATGSDVIMLIIYVLMALGFSFLCSVAEAVLLSMTPSFIADLKEKKPALAAILKRLKEDEVDRSLAAILTLNTIAHTVGAIGSGAKATIVFGSAYFGIFSAVMTLMILFLSEIIPKTLGATYWRRLAWPTSLFVRGLILCLYPLIWISEKLTQLVSGQSGHHGTFSRGEIVAMAKAGQRAGIVDKDESRVIQNLFKFRCLRAEDIMTPRTVVSALQKDTPIDVAVDEIASLAFTRLPIYSEDLDDIDGFVHRTDLLLALTQNKGKDPVSTLKRSIATVTHVTSLSQILEMFLKNHSHLALVVDEYGGTDGLVSLEDVVETLLGMEIVDEHDSIRDLQKLARENWEKRRQSMA